MKGNLYAILGAKTSRNYTKLAIESFLKSTSLNENDEFVLIDNDNEGNLFGVPIISHSSPKSFAGNCNFLIDKAGDRTLFLLSNDVVFTPNWNLPLTQFSNILLLPSCNQTHIYSHNNLNIQSSMNITEFDNRLDDLSAISSIHKSTNKSGFFEKLLMGFYVFVLPHNVYKKIGYFDESFGVGGGEDVDYRLRAIQLDIPVKYSTQSYLLHFAGKSTWDGPEQSQETKIRNQMYFEKFASKWGYDLANLCLVGGQADIVIEKYQLQTSIQSGNFSAAIKVVLNNQNR